ncbi:MAG: PQQ-binding-like beta-propeller repeat protein [Alphaproteobacteria bacterium]|nr:PQQ-binding-like beta-propeller repeat protein [Alphaproteobacteria bacterium]
MKNNKITGALCLLALAVPAFVPPVWGQGADWALYGGAGGRRFSSLAQITRANVGTLAEAWRFDMAEAGDPQTHPLAIGGVVYAYTPGLDTIALDGGSGKLLWRFHSGVKAGGPQRGLAMWGKGRDKRLFAAAGNYLYALDPSSGKPLPGFGTGGRIDLREGLGRDPDKVSLALTAPGAIWRDMIIMGFRTAESAPAAPGDIRAFDVRTGKLRWSFHTIPHPGEPGYESWPPDYWKSGGGANAWPGMVLDEKRGLVFAPTGSAVSDFYGADRGGDNRYANSLLALDANTGKLLWHFQGVHHDVADRDFPSPPVLLTLLRDGKAVNAVAQATKQGYLFVLDRVTGKPLFSVTEVQVAQSDLETLSPTQPVPSLPAPYARQHLSEDLLTNRTPQAHAWAVEQFRSFANDGPFPHMRLGQQTLAFPGFDGGAEWGGQASANGILYLNSNDVAWTGGLADSVAVHGLGARLYQDNCAACHGPDRKGAPPAFPSLLDSKLIDGQMADVIRSGRGRMPAFNLAGENMMALLNYVRSGEDKEMAAAPATAASPAYRFTGYRKFLDPDGYPAVAPPWGTLSAIDLSSGTYLWRIPLGEYPALADKSTGSENYGGPILTAGGVLFIAATLYDKKIRAFDPRNGTLLWQAQLPYAGNATPITYIAKGRQYVLIQADNARDKKSPQGAAYVAFALPNR